MHIGKNGWHNSSTDTEFETSIIKLNSVECCGWVEVSNFSLSPVNVKLAIKDLISITDGSNRFCIDGWNDEEDGPCWEYYTFPLHCVLLGNHRDLYHETLIKCGFVELKSWTNPNTGNVCTPYHFVPEDLKAVPRKVKKPTEQTTFG